jgi:hypothetical protein
MSGTTRGLQREDTLRLADTSSRAFISPWGIAKQRRPD